MADSIYVCTPKTRIHATTKHRILKFQIKKKKFSSNYRAFYYFSSLRVIKEAIESVHIKRCSYNAVSKLVRVHSKSTFPMKPKFHLNGSMYTQNPQATH